MKKLFLILLFLVPVFAHGAMININTASVSELETLTGIGEVIAGRIIEYRNANGLFKNIEEIKNVKGIGDAIFGKIKSSITVDSVVGGEQATNITQSEKTEEDESNNSVGTNDSAHTSPSPLSDYVSILPKIGAGRDRLATVKTPISFVVYDNKKKGEDEQVTYTWSFGDGMQAVGPKVSHAYQFAGEYNVVLNASYSSGVEAVARTKVKVSESGVYLTEINAKAGYLVIENRGANEQNINNWSLSDGINRYYFPLDTIISAGYLIKVPLTILGSATTGIALYYPDGQLASSPKMAKGQDVLALELKLKDLRQELSARQAIGTSLVPQPKRQNWIQAEETIVLQKSPTFLARLKSLIF